MCIPPCPLARMSPGLPWPLFLSVLLIVSIRPAASTHMWCKDDPPASSNTCAQLKDLGKCDKQAYPSMAGKCCRTCFDCEPGCTTYNISGERYLPQGAVESVDPYNVLTTDDKKIGQSGVSNALARVPCMFLVFTARCSHTSSPPPHTYHHPRPTSLTLSHP